MPSAFSNRDPAKVAVGSCRRDVADGLQEPPVVEPVYPFKGGELDGFERAPWPAPVDDLCFLEAIDCLGERVVVGIADAADRGLDTGLGQPLFVIDRDVLAASVAVVGEPALMNRTQLMQRLLQRIEYEACMCSPADPPSEPPSTSSDPMILIIESVFRRSNAEVHLANAG